MEHLKVGFITTVSGRWPRELPIARNAEYGAWLREKRRTPPRCGM